MNRTIKEATVKRYHYYSHRQLTAHLHTFINADNYGRRLKTLRGLTPYEYIRKNLDSTTSALHNKPAPAIARTKYLSLSALARSGSNERFQGKS